MRSAFLDALALGWLPILATTLMVGATWTIWYYAIGPGVEGSYAARLCARAPLACYIVPTVWNHCVIHGIAAMTLTGGPDFMLFIRERRRNQRAEKEAEERRQQEKKADEERYERMFGLLQNALEQANTERQRAEERAAQERERAAEERQAFLNTLTAVLARNGNGAN